MAFKAPRGTQDILPDQQALWRHVQNAAVSMSHRFGYERIETPMFEDVSLFVRGVGEGTDIVEKEMYTFEDKGHEKLSLRPEGTAGVCRAYIEHGMASLTQPVRLFYISPFFRYERPQAGRFRQFHQFGLEAIGDGDASVDAEVIELGWQFIQSLGLGRMTLVLNSIGDKACRPQYLQALRDHYAKNLERVCPDCKMRFEKNLLRVLDCKRTDFACQEVSASSPKTTDVLCAPCREHWEQLNSYIKALGIPTVHNHKLVRGLDYYTRTVFEIQPPEEGAQSTILAGGRYDGLIEELGGRPTPGIGFGTGIERLVANLKRQGLAEKIAPASVDALIVNMGATARTPALRLASDLRQSGLAVVLAPAGKSLKGQFRHADALKARAVLIIGDDELVSKTVSVKNMATGEQTKVPMDAVAKSLRDLTPNPSP